MKKHLLILSGFILGGIAVAQNTPVSQTVNKRVAVLEELTGINCQFCPDGHKRANEIAAANPGKVVLVNIHAGSFAPTSGANNFTTTAGNAIDDFLNPTGYPAGGVNRIPHSSDPSRIATGRGNWAGQVNTVVNENSEVNVAMNATIDAATRQLTVTVELFYPTPLAATTHYLNVGITQDNVESPHVNASTNPAQVLPNGNYNNMHMFRMFVNTDGVWGDAIDASTPTVITKTYTLTLPATIGGPALALGNLHLFAFVHEGHNGPSDSPILSAAQITPTYTNVPAATANAGGILNSFNICNGESITPIVKVNNSGNTITSINFSTVVNGGTPVPYTYNTAIPQFGSAEVTLPAMPVTAQGTNSVTVTITSVNGGSGVVGNVSVATKPIEIATTAFGLTGTVKMTTDRYGSETTWKLFNSANTVVASGGPYTNAAASGAFPQPDATVTLVPNECYRAVVYDSYGDGFDSGYGNGNFEIKVAGSTVASVSSFPGGSSLSDAMFVSQTASIDEVTEIANVSLYPNPASDVLNTSLNLENSGMVTFRVVNAQGQTIMNENVSMNAGSTVHSLDISALAAGIYTIQITSNGQVSARPFIKK